MPSWLHTSCLAITLLISLILLWELGTGPGDQGRFTSRLRPLDTSPKPSQLVEMNSTLGFQKIFVVNLPERSDKRDAMSLAASLTNISIDFVDGVRGETIPAKALPLHQESRTMPENMLGSWRAHMNAVRKVIEEGLSSALIIEDDGDWDIRIKKQLAQFAQGTRFLQGADTNTRPHSPYGDEWDVLWIGHCVDSMADNDQHVYAIQNDTSAADYRRLYHPYGKIPSWISSNPPHSRIVHQADAPICAFAYAVSYRGAQRILYNLAIKELQGIFDNALAWMCREKARGVRCLGVYPPLFYQHRAAGKAGKNSDNSDKTPEVTEAKTEALQWPVRMNFEKLLVGRADFEDQYAPWSENAEDSSDAS